MVSRSYEPGVSIVIVTYNSTPTLAGCLGSIVATLAPDEEIVLVDNASSDGTQEIIQTFVQSDPRIRAFFNEANLGFSEGCNVGIRNSNKEFICLLNPDTEVPAEWLQRMRSKFTLEGVGAVGPVSDNVLGAQQIQYHVQPGLSGNFTTATIAQHLALANDRTSIEVKLLIGFCLLLKRSVLDEVGLLDPELFLGCDDFDLSWRLQLAGYKLLVARDAFVHHVCHVSFDSVPKPETARLVQESFDKMARKLVAHYGPGNVPSEEELWGLEGWCLPSNELRRAGEPSSAPLCLPSQLSIGFYREGALNLGWPGQEYADILIDPAEPIPIGVPLKSRSFGNVVLTPGAFDSIICAGLLEHTRDVAMTMDSLCDLLKEGGRILIRCAHYLSPATWGERIYRNLFGPNAFQVYCERPDLVGWEDYKFEPLTTELHSTAYGWMLSANNNRPAAEVQQHPRTVDMIDYVFEKRAWKPQPMSQTKPLIPAISVVFATFRRRAMAMRQIDCLLSQTLPNVELFLIGDHCPEFESLLSDRYFRAKLELARSKGMIVHAMNMPENHGTPHEIINHVIANGTGTHLIFTADDDAAMPEHCERYLAAIDGTDKDIALLSTYLIGDYFTTTRFPKLELSHCGHSEVIVRMDAARKAPPHKPSDYHDWEFIAAVAQDGKWTIARNEPTYCVNLTKRTRLFRASA